jgi:hypothetical protein
MPGHSIAYALGGALGIVTRTVVPLPSALSTAIRLAAATPLDRAGEHRLDFRNDHLPEFGAYLANVLVPKTDAIAVTGQQHDPLQHGLMVRFRVAAQPIGGPRWMAVLPFALGLAMVLLHWRKRGDSSRAVQRDSRAIAGGTLPS